MVRFARRCLPLLALAVLAPSAPLQAQPFPTKTTIRLIVPDAAGGSPDQLGRVLAQKMSESMGQQVIVDNRAGAAGVLAAEIAAKAPADGYTLLLTTTSIYAILPSLRKNLSYDPLRDFVAVSRVATASNVMVVNATLPAKTVAEVVQLAKSKPGALNYASAGVASPAHLAGEMFNLLADVKMAHVPYKGAGPALLDVIAGNVQLIITSPIAAGAHMKEGRVRAIATTGTERNPGLPDLPTIAETLPGYEITQSWGIAVPAGTPPDVVKRLSDEVAKAMALPDVRQRVLSTGAVPVGDSPEAFAAFQARERARLADVIAKTGIVLND